MRSFAIVIRRAYFEAKKCRKYAKNVVVNRSVTGIILNVAISIDRLFYLSQCKINHFLIHIPRLNMAQFY